MTDKTTRRKFLGITTAGAAATLFPPLVSKSGTAAESPHDDATRPSQISTWVTSGNDRYVAGPKLSWSPASGTVLGEIKFDPNSKFQDLLGFGGAFTDAACYTFNQLSASAREKLFHELFDPSEMGLSIGRVCVGASDYSTKVYSYDEGEPDPELARFSIEHDREYILPILRQARKINPDIFLFSSPWSPPGWMKFNHTMLGGSMRRHYLPAYAQYYLKFLQAYAAEGVPIQALTTQNEVDTDQDGRMPACIWPQEYEIEFVRDRLGPLLESSGLPVKIWVLDHNYNLWGRAVCTLDDPKLRKYANAVAWHGYVGAPDVMSKVHDAFPDTEMHWTEGGPDINDPAYLTDWCKWSGAFGQILTNWCRSITSWNLALDEQGHPNIGPFPCGGVVTIHSQTKEITRSGQYWALAHYSRNIHRGARRFRSDTGLTDLQHVAFENTDGSRVVVLTNPGPARTIRLQSGNFSAPVSLQSDSVTTLVWR